MKLTLLLLANSYKHGGRCLAGLRTDTWQWVRPVSERDGHEISTSACATEDGPLRPLDIISLTAIRPEPLAHQEENVVVREETIRKVGRNEVSECANLLQRTSSKLPYFAKTSNDSIDAIFFTKGPPSRPSLALIEVPEAQVYPGPSSGGAPAKSRRIRFMHSGNHWDLRFTDENVKPRTAKFDTGPAFLCVSIGDYFAKKNAHYKMVASLIPIASCS